MGLYDDIIYTLLLIISIVCGPYIIKINETRLKKYVSAGIGFLMVLFVCGQDVVHSLTVVLVNGAIVCFCHPSKCQIISFIWCFGYIVFFRMTHYVGLPMVVPHANAVQLLLTLKMVGLAYEVHDCFTLKNQLKKEDGNEKLKLKFEYTSVSPSFWDVVIYAYCYIGLLTGPYFKYRAYRDMMQRSESDSIDIWTPVMKNVQKLPLYIFCYLLGTYFFDIKYAASDEFGEHCFAYRFFYMTIMFTLMRVRFYTAWVLSECICMTAGLGAYPHSSKPRCGVGPTDFVELKNSESLAPNAVVYDFETIHNIDEYECDFSMTVREGMRGWNRSVQYWLAHHVYKRLPFRNVSLKVAVTMLVSAFWHGIHPGYYLSFMTIPMCLMAEDLLIARFYKPASPKLQKKLAWVIWFIKMRAFDYMAMGFLLLTLQDTLRYWGYIYYACHVWTLAIIAVCMIYRPARKSNKSKMVDGSNGEVEQINTSHTKVHSESEKKAL